jgi:hypothetical protein
MDWRERPRQAKRWQILMAFVIMLFGCTLGLLADSLPHFHLHWPIQSHNYFNLMMLFLIGFRLFLTGGNAKAPTVNVPREKLLDLFIAGNACCLCFSFATGQLGEVQKVAELLPWAAYLVPTVFAFIGISCVIAAIFIILNASRPA